MKHFAIRATIAFQLFLVMVAFDACASGYFEDGGTTISKKYLNGNEVSLTCGVEVNKCLLETKVFGVRGTFEVNFDRVSLKPSFDNIALMTALRSSNRYLVSFSVDCSLDQLRYMGSINANGMNCYSSMEIEGNSNKWVVTESTPTYRSKTWKIRSKGSELLIPDQTR